MSSNDHNWQFLTIETYELMIRILKTPRNVNIDGIKPHVKQTVMRNYQLVQSDGNEKVVSKKTSKQLLLQEDAEAFLKSKHEPAHLGQDTSRNKVLDVYHYIPKEFVLNFVKNCIICQSRIPLAKPPAGRAITSKGFVSNRLKNT